MSRQHTGHAKKPERAPEISWHEEFPGMGLPSQHRVRRAYAHEPARRYQEPHSSKLAVVAYEPSLAPFLMQTVGLSSATAHWIALQLGRGLEVLLRMKNQQIREDIENTATWRTHTQHVTEQEFAKLFRALDHQRSILLPAHTMSSTHNPFFV